MFRRFCAAALAAAFVPLALTTPVAAHATLERTEAPADSYYIAVIRVPHGCVGSPTLKLRVQIPDGVTAVKPQPKPGWQLAIVKARLDPALTDGHGNTITEAVREVAWTGRLPDEYFDQFAMSVKLPAQPGVLYWKIVQECETGVHRWIEVPEAGKTARDYKEPAPALTLTPKAPAH
jgi:periplasmic copper chaperone A